MNRTDRTYWIYRSYGFGVFVRSLRFDGFICHSGDDRLFGEQIVVNRESSGCVLNRSLERTGEGAVESSNQEIDID